jgi:hypothetical protein
MKMKFVFKVDDKEVVLNERQLQLVLEVLDNCEELRQVYKGDGKGSRGSSNQYIDEIYPIDPRGGFQVKPLSETYYDTLKLVDTLGKA